MISILANAPLCLSDIAYVSSVMSFQVNFQVSDPISVFEDGVEKSICSVFGDGVEKSICWGQVEHVDYLKEKHNFYFLLVSSGRQIS